MDGILVTGVLQIYAIPGVSASVTNIVATKFILMAVAIEYI